MGRIIFHFLHFYYAEMLRKLWPKAPAKESQMATKISSLLYTYKLFKKPNEKNLQWSQRIILRYKYICYIYTALGQMSKNFQVYSIPINFFKKPKKINLQQSQRVILRCYYTRLFILYCLLAQKKWRLKNGPRLPSPLYPFPFSSKFKKFWMQILNLYPECYYTYYLQWIFSNT